MFEAVKTPARKYAKGMGKAVADRTVNRREFRPFKKKTWIKFPYPENLDLSLWAKENDYEVDKYVTVSIKDGLAQVKALVKGKYETEEWEDVAFRVAVGNSSLLSIEYGNEDGDLETRYKEFKKLNHHLRQASMILSGRHLQHGDASQPERNQEVFTNCSTSALSSLVFYLLLNGSGVGRCYDDDMMLVNWDNMPRVVCVIDRNHKDVLSGEINAMTPADAKHLYGYKKLHTFVVPDSREGWAKAVEKIEIMAFEGIYREDVLLLDFSSVRAKWVRH
jgi:hypothetical protein